MTTKDPLTVSEPASAESIRIGGSPAASVRAKLTEGTEKYRAQAASKARDIAETGKGKTATALKSLSETIEGAAHTVDDKLGADYGKYARKAAESISNLSSAIEAKEIDELATDARDFVRKSPAVALGVAAAAGFLLARFLKSGSGSDQTGA